MKSYKQLLESLPPITHMQSTVGPDGRLIKIMSDGSEIPYNVKDIPPNEMDNVLSVTKDTIINIIKDSIPFFAKGFVSADLDDWNHILNILVNWGKEGGDIIAVPGEGVGYYLPIKYLNKAKKKLKDIIDDGNIHPDVNYNAWILETLQSLYDNVME